MNKKPCSSQTHAERATYRAMAHTFLVIGFVKRMSGEWAVLSIEGYMKSCQTLADTGLRNKPEATPTILAEDRT